jgi:DNA-binding CsgD family transcriptional regulator
VRTIQTHLDHIYRKLDVETRAAAVAKAMETR